MHVDPTEVLTLEGFCKLRRELDAQPTGFGQPHSPLQSFGNRHEPAHLVLGLKPMPPGLADHGDAINHRLLKAIIKGETIARPG